MAVFFVLSGYLLFAPWVRRLHDAGPSGAASTPSVAKYAWHRARRVLPAYWITVIVVYLIYLPAGADAGGTGLGWSGFVRNMTFTQVYGYGHLHVGLTQMWSMAAEVAYYVVLPPIAWVLVVVACRRRWRRGALIGGLAVLLVVSPVWSLAVDGASGADATARMWPPAFFGWFVGGMLLAACRPLIRRWPATPSVAVALTAFLVSACAFAGEPTIIPTQAGATVVKHALYLLAAVALIGPLTWTAGRRGVDGWWARVCGSSSAVWLGEISYEFFLVHVVVLEFVMVMLDYPIFNGSVWTAFLVTSALSIPIAWALHMGTYRVWLRPAVSRSAG